MALDRGARGRFLPSDDPVDVRFWALVRGPWIDPGLSVADCWPWLGTSAGSRPPKSWDLAKPWKRYGRFRFAGRMENANRVALILFAGPPPADDDVASHYRCDGDLCCNPYHLRWESQAANIAGALERGRLIRTATGRFASAGAI